MSGVENKIEWVSPDGTVLDKGHRRPQIGDVIRIAQLGQMEIVGMSDMLGRTRYVVAPWAEACGRRWREFAEGLHNLYIGETRDYVESLSDSRLMAEVTEAARDGL